MHPVDVAALPWEEQRSPSGKFQSFSRNVSLALGGIRNTGTWGGGHPFDVQVRRIPVGAAVCPFHLHLAQWELFVVTAGTGSVRTTTETRRVSVGDVFVHPPGEAHQLLNTGATDLEVIILSDNPLLDAFYYPDSNKWGLRPPGKFFRMAEVGYFDGEDAAPAGPAPTSPAPAAVPAAPALPFSSRICHVDALPWDEWQSPKGRFRGAAKELSIALGAQRNTPTGLGGHPFELELSRLAPGLTGCPFHSHAAQWELFWILRGTATVRAGDQTHTLSAGHVCLHPPGEAHQILNASASEDLLFYIIADTPPADYWHYPDSGKWGVRQPRQFFRMTNVEYYDGEDL
jgi:uncharacterized cupin superfamily protein